MFQSIWEDFKNQFRSGNVLVRIIIANISLFVLVKLLYVFTQFSGGEFIYENVKNNLVIHAELKQVLLKFWTIITHMFFHEGTWHLFWNMLLLYWFGKIIGDFLGDKRMLPLYILGGLVGAFFFILSDHFSPFGNQGVGVALGASAAVMTMLMAAAATSPDYSMNLLFIGPVKLKYIALVLLFFDIVGTAGNQNSGGHFAHLGGAIFGVVYVAQLRKGNDLTGPLQRFFEWIKSWWNEEPRSRKSKSKNIRIVHKKNETSVPHKSKRTSDHEEKLNKILEKINNIGYEKLSDEEKEFLFQASKKS